MKDEKVIKRLAKLNGYYVAIVFGDLSFLVGLIDAKASDLCFSSFGAGR